MEKIASKMFISPDTIKFHKKNLFAKLQVKSISEAIMKSMELSLL